MSQGSVMNAKSLEKDFIVATPEEFVKKFGGTKVINKVRFFSKSRFKK
jgi:acetyl-CoA carboxylase / biotin carboxylase 1